MIRIYLSHAISCGSESTPVASIKENCHKARSVARRINCELNRYMATDIYVPGGQTEEFVRRAWLKKMLTTPQIMEIDCDILADCNFVLCYVPEGDTLQGGRLIEVDHAKKRGIPYYIFSDVMHAVEYVRAFYSAHKELNQEVHLE